MCLGLGLSLDRYAITLVTNNEGILDIDTVLDESMDKTV